MSAPGRFYSALCLVTFAVQLAGLQLRLAVFGGRGWLSTVKYVTFGERAGFVFILLLFSAASVGLWLSASVGLARLLRVTRSRALSAAAVGWIAVLAIDFIVRQEVSRLTADAVALISAEEAAGGVGGMLRNVWMWYGTTILWVVAGCVAAAWAAHRLWRRFRKAEPSWSTGDGIGVGAASLGTLLFLTVFAQAWPRTRTLLTAQTLVGYPFGAAVGVLTDFDGDGHGPFDSPSDTAPFDGTRHPYAVEIPGDGVDQDLIAGDLAIEEIPPDRRAAIEALSDYPPVTFRDRKNVVVILLESVRHDALTTRIRGRDVTPRLRELIESGAAAPSHAFASNGFTYVSVTQLFWGGFRHPGSTLIDDAHSNGYTVACFSGAEFGREGADWNFGLEKADVVVDAAALPMTQPFRTARAADVAGAVEAFVEARRDPFFIYALFDDPHFPYLQHNPPVLCDGPIAISKIDRDHVEALRAAYFNQVYHVDEAVGRVVDALKRAGVYDETLLIVMSDHGESLFDDGFLLGHGTQLNDAMTRCAAVVANAPGAVPDVLSHHHVRGLVRAWLTGTPPRDDGRVVQFLGSLDAPAQIASVTAGGRLTYDFRTGSLAEEPGGGATDDALRRRGRDLILEWEYLQVASGSMRP